MYKILIEKKAHKELLALPIKEQKKVKARIRIILTSNPFPRGNNPLLLKGIKAYRLRIGSYRVLYTIGQDLV